MIEDDLDKPATRRDVLDLRRHFDVVAESFRSDFRNLFDWTQSTTDTLGNRVDRLEDRVARLERRKRS